MRCTIYIGALSFGDPASGCAKDFRVLYQCPPYNELLESAVGAEALGKQLTLDCELVPTRGIWVKTATYGGNCANVAPGNASDAVRRACNGKMKCNFKVDVGRLGDPANGCAKDFVALYQCGAKTSSSVRVHGEANGKTVALSL